MQNGKEGSTKSPAQRGYEIVERETGVQRVGGESRN